MSYLDQGGNLYIEGVDLGVDLIGSEFFGYLGLCYEYNGDEYDVEALSSTGYMMNNLSFNYAGGNDPHYSVDWLCPTGPAKAMFTCDDGIGRMFVYEENNYKTVSSTILLGALQNGNNLNLKPYLISEIVNYFLGISVITSVDDIIADENINIKSYPNPFVDHIRIEYTLEKEDDVRLEIYNQNGQLIKQLVDETQLSGEYSVMWDGTNNQSMKVGGGVYFFKVILGEKSSTGKVVLLK